MDSRPGVEVRVLPDGIGPHPGLAGSFSLFRMPRPYPAVGYVESLAGRLFVEAPLSARFDEAYDRMLDSALDARQSAKLIAGLTENL
jgi:hypothetical protein